MKKILLGIMMICLLCNMSFAINEDDFMQEPKIEIMDSEVIYSNDDILIGFMKIKNTTNVYFQDMYYDIGIVTYTETMEEELLESCVLGKSEAVHFDIGANQTKTVYFTYNLPKSVPEDITELAVNFYTRTMQLSEGETFIKLNKTIKCDSVGFLNPDYTKELAVWKLNNEVVRADTGPNLKPSSTAIAKFTVTSTFNRILEATPKITIYKRMPSYEGKPVLTQNAESIKFNPKEKKDLEIEIPIVKEPDSYFVKIELCDENGKVISHEYDYRYVVEGENAKILTAYLTEEDNGKVKLNIFATGPADGKNELTDAKLTWKVTDTNNGNILVNENCIANLGKILGRKIIELEKYDNDVKIQISLDKDKKKYDSTEFLVNLNNLFGKEEGFYDITDISTRNAVEVLNVLGIVNGYPDGTFRADNNITRAEFTVIATRLAGLTPVKGQASTFTDVPENHWAKDYINLAQANGCISGYGNGIFKPDNNVTIAESITILVNVLGYKNNALKSSSTWPYNYIDFAREIGISDGVMYNDKNEAATRGKVCCMTLNSLKLK